MNREIFTAKINTTIKSCQWEAWFGVIKCKYFHVNVSNLPALYIYISLYYIWHCTCRLFLDIACSAGNNHQIHLFNALQYRTINFKYYTFLALLNADLIIALNELW